VTEIAGKRFRMYYKPDTLLRLDSVNVASNSGITFMARDYRYSALTGALDRVKLNAEQVLMSTNPDLLPSTTTYPANVNVSHLWTANHGLYDRSFSKTGLDTAFRRAYGYDGQGRMTEYLRRVNNQWAVKQYAYDSLGRLTKRGEATYASCAAADTTKGYNCMPDGTTPVETYGYDEVGNRSDFTLTTGNRIQSGDIYQFSHDLDGNISAKWIISPYNVVNYTWSADGRLEEVNVNGDTVQYQYDPLGRLVRKQRKGVTERHFLWDGDQLLAEVNATATARIAEYSYWPGIDRPLGFATGATSIDKIRYYAQDAVGSVVGVYRDSTVGAQLSYTDWGRVESAPALSDTNRLHWKGLVREADLTNMYYVRNRLYDGTIGRFISEDPIGLRGGVNKYVFGASDPINSSDPFGLMVQVDTPLKPDLTPIPPIKDIHTLETVRIVANRDTQCSNYFSGICVGWGGGSASFFYSSFSLPASSGGNTIGPRQRKPRRPPAKERLRANELVMQCIPTPGGEPICMPTSIDGSYNTYSEQCAAGVGRSIPGHATNASVGGIFTYGAAISQAAVNPMRLAIWAGVGTFTASLGVVKK
jgi:RHS repeat-associated protein